MHVIPWKLLREGFAAIDPQDPAATMPERILRLLLEAALESQPFDAPAYLAANPDVADAIRSGKCPSAKFHYMNVGYFEGRNTGDAGFDEAWYLQRYPDVLRAVRQGKSASGLEHFRGPGVREWRSPNKAAEADIARWRTAIQATRPATPAKAAARPGSAAAVPKPPAVTATPVGVATTGLASAGLATTGAAPAARRRRPEPATIQLSASRT